MSELLQELSKSILFVVTDKTVQLSPIDTSKSAPGSIATGTIVDGKYKILGLLGEGGMGAVYLAHHRALNKEVALKTFLSGHFNQESCLRFQREAQAIAKLEHPNIIQVYDFGYPQNDMPYYTMEYLRGESLADRLNRLGPLSLTMALEIFIQVCRGLSAAHKKGIVHRDLKPANIFLSSVDGNQTIGAVKIVDFGIASLASDNLPHSGSIQQLTGDGEIFGSPLYMSPEQSLGEHVTAQSDIYSLGCALFETLSGRPPFLGANALATIYMHQTSPAPSLNNSAANIHEANTSAANSSAANSSAANTSAANSSGPKAIGPFPQRLEELLKVMLAKTPQERCRDIDTVEQELLWLAKRSANERANPRSVPGQIDQGLNHFSDDDNPQPPINTSKNKLIKPLLIGAIIAGIMALAMMTTTNMKSGKNEQSRSTIEDSAVNFQPGHSATAEKTMSGNQKSNEPGQSSSEPGQSSTEPDQSSNKPGSETEESAQLYQQLRGPLPEGRLDLLPCNLSAADLQAIGQTGKITNLNIDSCTFENERLQELTGLPLTVLCLNGTNFNDNGARTLAKFRHLETLKISATKITDKGVKYLAEIPTLSNLTMESDLITDQALIPLGRKPNLLRLSMTEVGALTDEGLKHICSTPLTTIELAHTKIGDKGLTYLERMPKLEIIDLRDTLVTERGVRNLCQKTKAHFVYLNFCRNISEQERKNLTRDFPKKEFSKEERRNPANL